MSNSFYKKYAPNPRLKRDDYQFLCGEWSFCFSEDGKSPIYDKKIVVPYSYESEASGIGDQTPHSCVWYKKEFTVKSHNGAVLLHCEGIDYHSFIYVNDVFVEEHVGGFTSFCVDITSAVKEDNNVIEIKVLDSLDKSQLRGKQRAKNESYDCWYVQTTGIWKPIWIEYAGEAYVKELSFKTKNDGRVEAFFELNKTAKVDFTVLDSEGRCVYQAHLLSSDNKFERSFKIENPRYWSSSSPYLYRVMVSTSLYDNVESYFGFCNIKVSEAGLMINGKREYQQMILYQGYWQESMLSAPDDLALERDIDMIKAMGFNGIRVHQKIENEVFYYLCDKKGLYVWGEIPSAYEFTERMQSEISRDCELIFNQLKNHVCVISWLLFNETWGVYQINDDKAQQAFVEGLAEKLKQSDGRPVITNDGWYHLNSDILSLHEYEQNANVFAAEYSDKTHLVTEKTVNENKFGKAFAKGYFYKNQPIFISEYGGISMRGSDGWGYGDSAADLQDYEVRLKNIVKTVLDIPYVSGCCYTQFNDTQQETNGLLDASRKEKLPLDVYNKIFAAYK